MRQNNYMVDCARDVTTFRAKCDVPKAALGAASPVCGTDANMEKRPNESLLSFLSIAYNNFRCVLFSKLAPKSYVPLPVLDTANKAIVFTNGYKH